MEMKEIFRGRSGNIVGISVGSRPVSSAADKIKSVFCTIGETVKENANNIFLKK